LGNAEWRSFQGSRFGVAGPARARLKPQDVQPALGPSAKNFENDFGLNVTIQTLEKMMDSFPLPAQVAKGQDMAQTS